MTSDSDVTEMRPPQKMPAALFVQACYEWMEALIPALIVILIFFTLLFRVVTVSGPSMQPNLWDGNRLLVSCLPRAPKPGDIVVIDARATTLNRVLVKRVIATGGQTVNIDFQTGVVSVDGAKLDESAYIQNGITRNQYDVSFPQTVPEGHVFVLGDNRVVSEDSRFAQVGMIDERYLIGRAAVILTPVSEWKILGSIF